MKTTITAPHLQAEFLGRLRDRRQEAALDARAAAAEEDFKPMALATQHLLDLRSSNPRSEIGAILPLFALLIVGIVVLIALGIDTSRNSSSSSQQLHTAEYLALAALEAYSGTKFDIDEIPSPRNRYNERLRVAKERIEKIAGRNFLLGKQGQKQVEEGQEEILLGNQALQDAEAGVLTPGRWWFKKPPECSAAEDSFNGDCPCGMSDDNVNGCFEPNFPENDFKVNAFKVALKTKDESPIKNILGSVTGSPIQRLEHVATATMIPKHGVFLVDLSKSTVFDTHTPIPSRQFDIPEPVGTPPATTSEFMYQLNTELDDFAATAQYAIPSQPGGPERVETDDFDFSFKTCGGERARRNPCLANNCMCLKFMKDECHTNPHVLPGGVDDDVGNPQCFCPDIPYGLDLTVPENQTLFDEYIAQGWPATCETCFNWDAEEFPAPGLQVALGIGCPILPRAPNGEPKYESRDTFTGVYRYYMSLNPGYAGGPAMPDERPAGLQYKKSHFRKDYRCFIRNVPGGSPTDPVKLNGHYLVDSFVGNVKDEATGQAIPYIGPEPLYSILGGIQEGLKVYEDRSVFGDRVGIIGFDDSPRAGNAIGMTAPYTANFEKLKQIANVTDTDPIEGANVTNLDNLQARIDAGFFPVQFSNTDIVSALKRSLQLFESTSSVQAKEYTQRFVVLFTDGLPNCYRGDCDLDIDTHAKALKDDSYNPTDDSIAGLVQQFKEENIVIHVVLTGDLIQPHSVLRKAGIGANRCKRDLEYRKTKPPIPNPDRPGESIMPVLAEPEDSRDGAWESLFTSSPSRAYLYPNHFFYSDVVGPTKGFFNTMRKPCAPPGAMSEEQCNKGELDKLFDQKCGTLGDLTTIANPGAGYSDAQGRRLVCDPKCRSKNDQVKDFIKDIFSLSPYILVE